MSLMALSTHEKTYNDSDDSDEYSDCSSSNSKESSSSSNGEGEDLLEKLLRSPAGEERKKDYHDIDEDEECSHDEDKCIALLKTLGDQGRHTVWEGKDYRQKWNEFKNYVMERFDARLPSNGGLKKYKVKFYKDSKITGYHDLSYDRNPDSFSYKMTGYFSLSLNTLCFPLDMPDSELPTDGPLQNEQIWIDNIRRYGFSNVSIVPLNYKTLKEGGELLDFSICEDPSGKQYEEELGSELVILKGKCTDVNYDPPNEVRKPKMYRVIMKFMGQREDPSYYNTIPRKELLSFKEKEEKRMRQIINQLDNVEERLQSLKVSVNPAVLEELKLEEEKLRLDVDFEERKEESPITNVIKEVEAKVAVPVKKARSSLSSFFENPGTTKANLFDEAASRVLKNPSNNKKRKRSNSVNKSNLKTSSVQPKSKRQKTKTSNPVSSSTPAKVSLGFFDLAKSKAGKKNNSLPKQANDIEKKSKTNPAQVGTEEDNPNVTFLENFSTMVERDGSLNYTEDKENYVNYFCALSKTQAFALYEEYLTFLVKISRTPAESDARKIYRKSIREKKIKWREYTSNSALVLSPFDDQKFRWLLKDLVLLRETIKS